MDSSIHSPIVTPIVATSPATPIAIFPRKPVLAYAIVIYQIQQ